MASSPDREEYEEGGMDEEGIQPELLMQLRSVKDELIGRILARWWYVLPEWPEPGYDYEQKLREKKLKKVPFDQWELADDVDSDGYAKVYEITHFPGVFRDAKGNAIDLRSEEGKPCYKFLSTRFSEKELREMLKTALTNQIKDLENSPYQNTDAKYIARLKLELNRFIQEEQSI